MGPSKRRYVDIADNFKYLFIYFLRKKYINLISDKSQMVRSAVATFWGLYGA